MDVPKSDSHRRFRTPIPGPRSRRLVQRLHRFECPHITYCDRDFPVFWEKARGSTVTDVDGNRYIDLTAAFAVSNLGHAPGYLRRAIGRQIKDLWHAMGDVHPHRSKLELAQAIAQFLPRPLSQVIFSSSGSEAVESALKTAYLYTGKPGVMAFEGAYHGLGYGALQATYRSWFREPFVRQTGSFVVFRKFIEEGTESPRAVELYLESLRGFLRSRRRSRKTAVGAILIEPIQGRAGIRVADRDFLKGLRRISRQEEIVLVADEIFTGWGRTGRWFAFEDYGIVPDIVCLGKGMANGFPISACVSSPRIMRAWGPSTGESRHTSTFLGNPLGCAMALATLRELRRGRYLVRVREKGLFLRSRLEEIQGLFPHEILVVRGRGLMLGLEFVRPEKAQSLVKEMLKRGIIVLSSGKSSETLSFTPPFTIGYRDMDIALAALKGILKC